MPNTPHLVAISSPLTDGKEILVEGKVHPEAKRVTVSLNEGPDFKQNVALTFDARFPDNVIVRNHLANNKWGTEDRHGGLPLKKGENAEIKIVVKNEHYQIFVNKQHFCDFKHHIGKEAVRYVLVEGDFTINTVSVPGSDAGQQARYPEGHSLQDPPVPLNIGIAPLRPGRKLIISCVPTGKDRFTVNLVCGPGPNDDIALHIDVRFHFGNFERKVILNHRAGGNWGGEDVEHSGFPFIAGEACEIVIKVKESSFKIIVNDEKFDLFPFRIDVTRITHLNVVGAVRLTHVKV